MRASKIAEYLVKVYETQQHVKGRRLSVILLGPPGVGKTVSVREAANVIAQKLGVPLVEDGRGEGFHFLAFSVLHLDPVDFSGVPRDAGDVVSYKPIDIFEKLLKPDARGILFLDEFTLDDRTDRRAALLKLVDEGYLGYRRLSAGVMVVLAGNTSEWSRLAQELDEPMRRGRARIIFVDPPTLEEWLEYMNVTYHDKWDRRVGAYLSLYPDELFTKSDSAADAGYGPLNSPRNFTNLAVTLPLLDDPELVEQEVRSLLDSQTATKLLTFLNTYVPPVEDIAASPKMWTSLTREAKYLLISQLSQREDFDIFSELYRLLADSDHESLILLRVLQTDQRRQKFTEYLRRHQPSVFKVLVDIVKRGDEV
ncbi:MAG: AAA family ATPase [Candidatus Caldarchaeum sp.]